MAMLHTSPQPTGTLCLVLLLILSLDFLPTGAENPHEKIRRCGRNLIDTLKKACNHNYIQPDQAQFQGTYYRTLVRAKRSARRSITHDCCANKCSLQYIQNTYCGAPPSQDDHYTGRSDSYHLSHGEMFGRALAGGRHYFISVRSMSATFEYQGLNVAQKSQGVVHVELNRPDSRNAFTLQLWEDLYEVFNRLSDYAPCRAIVLSGSGKSFCAGIDVKSAGITGVVEIINREGLDVARKARELRKIIKICQDGFTAVEKCVKPVIVAVHGHCIGAGISLASCCDIRYSTSDAVFSIKEVDVGLAADVGILQRIRMITGNDSWARELAFTARNASGSEALSHGLVSRTFDSQQECLAAAFDLAKEIASKSPIAVQGSKVAMNYARNHGVDDSIEWMLTWNCAQLQTEDIVKNVAAMISKESPSFDDA